jgi:hypothetical protein
MEILVTRANKSKYISPGHYRTLEGNEVIIIKVISNRAYGHLVDCRDSTWWYADSGEHGLYPSDDLIEKIKS